MKKERKQVCLTYLKARKEFLEYGNNDKVLKGNDNIVGRIGEAIAHSFLEQKGRRPEMVESQSNAGYDITCDDGGKTRISVKLITAENKGGSSSKIKHEWDELIGIELDEDFKVFKIGVIKREKFDAILKERNRILEPNFSRAMLKDGNIIKTAGKIYEGKKLEEYDLI